MMFFDAVNLLRAKRGAVHSRMTNLAALTTPSLRCFVLGRLDDIRGWRLGRIGRILGQPGYLLGKLRVLVDQSFVVLDKFGDLRFQGRNSLVASSQLSFQLGDSPLIGFVAGRFHRPFLI